MTSTLESDVTSSLIAEVVVATVRTRFLRRDELMAVSTQSRSTFYFDDVGSRRRVFGDNFALNETPALMLHADDVSRLESR